MKFDLAAMTKRARNTRRKAIVLQPIKVPATFASDLYAVYYKPIVQAWTEALPGIVAEYERSFSQLQTDSAASIEARIEATNAGAVTLIISYRSALERWADRVANWHRQRWARAVRAATTVDLTTLIGPQDMRETLEAVIARNVGLVRSVSDETHRRIADSVFRGLQARTPPREVAKQIEAAVAMGRQRALRIAADQNTKLSSALNEERRRQAGIDSWLWLHSRKRHPRPEHEARDGNLYSEDPAKQGTEYEGKLVRRPPDKTDWPGMAPFCGCTTRAVLILEE